MKVWNSESDNLRIGAVEVKYGESFYESTIDSETLKILIKDGLVKDGSEAVAKEIKNGKDKGDKNG